MRSHLMVNAAHFLHTIVMHLHLLRRFSLAKAKSIDSISRMTYEVLDLRSEFTLLFSLHELTSS